MMDTPPPFCTATFTDLSNKMATMEEKTKFEEMKPKKLQADMASRQSKVKSSGKKKIGKHPGVQRKKAKSKCDEKFISTKVARRPETYSSAYDQPCDKEDETEKTNPQDTTTEVFRFSKEDKQEILGMKDHVQSIAWSLKHQKPIITLYEKDYKETKRKIIDKYANKLGGNHKFVFERVHQNPRMISTYHDAMLRWAVFSDVSSSGTVGGYVSKGENVWYAATCRHIFAPHKRGDRACQFLDENKVEHIGTIDYHIDMTDEVCTGNDNIPFTFDIALVKLSSNLNSMNNRSICNCKLFEFESLEDLERNLGGKVVQKIGNASKLTKGLVDKVYWGALNVDGKDTKVNNSLFIENEEKGAPFSIPGDSGAFLYMKEKNVNWIIGMCYLVGKSPDSKKTSVVFPLANALNEAILKKYPNDFRPGQKFNVNCGGQICDTEKNLLSVPKKKRNRIHRMKPYPTPRKRNYK
ncbi:unnamed protein product [Owenia fusiformis]|uniref:Uncharacterized protein n=1 Tax=Owenia fusiformis TaxID=6347 RepID=A0A8J1UKM2_OWEFU|nr:unnamed protein product [Owenia fusiformis]